MEFPELPQPQQHSELRDWAERLTVALGDWVDRIRDSSYLPLTGGTVEGGVKSKSTYPSFSFWDTDGAADKKKVEWAYNASVLGFHRYSDADVYLDTPFSIDTGAGVINFGYVPYIPQLLIQGTSPWIFFHENDAPVGQKRWSLAPDAGSFGMHRYNDAGVWQQQIYSVSATTGEMDFKVKPRVENWVLPLSRFFESGEQTITAGGGLTLAHGLGLTPKLIQAHLICKTGQHNYAVNDVLLINPHINTFGSAGQGLSIRWDGTNVLVRFGNNAAPFNAFDANSGAAVTLTNANWRLVVRAWG